MKRYVVDASVVIKWFLPEVHSAAALRLLLQPEATGEATSRSENDYILLVPDLVFAEVGNILWKRTRLRTSADLLSAKEAATILQAVQEIGLSVYPCELLAQSSLEIASQTGRTVYDSLYVALAVY